MEQNIKKLPTHAFSWQDTLAQQQTPTSQQWPPAAQ